MGACSLIDLIDLGDYLIASEETLLQSKQTVVDIFDCCYRPHLFVTYR